MAQGLKNLLSRRELFVKLLRGGVLALIAMGMTGEALKRRRLMREGTCINRGICRRCRVFERCGLPAALSAKEEPGGK